MKNKVEEQFGGRVRTRVCGINIKEDAILLIRHEGIGESGELWIPPGGELHFKEMSEQALIREFKEETSLNVKVGKLLAVNEFSSGKLHAIELFFLVEVEGQLKMGTDPELSDDEQMIKEVRYVTFSELNKLPDIKKHNLLHGKMSKNALLNMNGYFKLCQ